MIGLIVWSAAFVAMGAFLLVPFLPDRKRGKR